MEISKYLESFIVSAKTNFLSFYLNNSSLNKEQRKVLVRQEAGPYKGTAGKKTAGIIITLLQNSDQSIEKAQAYSRNI